MKGKFFIVCIFMFVTSIISYQTIGCSNKEYETCKASLEDLSTKLSSCHQETSTLQTKNSELETKSSDLEIKNSEMAKKIDELSQTADGLWIQMTQCTHDDCVEQTADSFIDKYPREPRVAEAKKKIFEIKKKREEYERLAKEDERIKESIARTESATIEEIKADPNAYRKNLFSRTMCCANVELDDYVEPTYIAEINFRSTKIYTSRCYWRWKRHHETYFDVDIDSAVQMRLTQEQAKTFAKQTGNENASSCKYLIRGTVYFGGQIDNSPVMYLKEVEFQ